MTGYRSSHFRHRCGAAANCYINQLPNWDDLIACLPRGIRPTDVDGMVEVNGNFLFLEEKGAGVGLGTGQGLALRRLSGRPGITTACIRPPNPKLHLPTDLECLILGEGPPQGWRPLGREWFKDWLRQWAEMAERFPFDSEAA